MTAEEANKIAHEVQMNKVYQNLHEQIEEAVSNGNFSIYTHQSLVPELVEKLEKEGYSVVGSELGGAIISW